METMHYKPQDAWTADIVPFYENGEFKLYFLLDWRNREKYGEGVPWYLIGTKDFLHFTEYGEVLARGSKEEQDLYVFTGSVIKKDETYHIIYTGANPYFPKEGKCLQGIMHAVSDDMVHWTKKPEETFFAPPDEYEPDDWRDPFVFWNDEAGEYGLLVAGRSNKGPSRRRGVTVHFSSRDLMHWEFRGDFYAPGLYQMLEVPDLFRIGEWWYLVFSEFSERFTTRYRMSRSISGPWISTDEDTFDGKAFYGAKTWSDGAHRYIFGWNPSRENEKDYTPWQWGGHLVVHEVLQNADGSLRVNVPECFDRAFADDQALHFRHGTGTSRQMEDGYDILAVDSFSCILTEDPMPSQCRISFIVNFTAGTKGCGIMLRSDKECDKAYFIRLEPHRNRMVFDSWPRQQMDIPFMLELERPVHFTPGRDYQVKVFVDGSICEVYLDERIAMSARMYDLKEGHIGLFVNEGSAAFRDARIAGVEG
jgi:beta-fructofuranosidase